MASLSNATGGRRTGARNRRLQLLLIPALALVGAFFLYPILDLTKASLFDPAFTIAHFVKFFTQKLYLRVSLNTIEIAFVTTLLCAAMGYPAAYFLAHSNAKRRPLLIFLILLPMWISVLIRSYAWMAVLGREGLINTFLMATELIAEPLSMLYTTGAVYLAMVQILLPIMILTCYGVMRDIEMDLIKAAHVLGAGKFRAFLYVYLPLSLSGLRNGSIIIFILSMGFFITPELVGGRKDMMIGNLIVFQIDKLANWSFASAIGIVLLIATVCIVLVMRAGLDRVAPSRARTE
jgi:putative spermidine/putrescine transport system permease protein